MSKFDVGDVVEITAGYYKGKIGAVNEKFGVKYLVEIDDVGILVRGEELTLVKKATNQEKRDFLTQYVLNRAATVTHTFDPKGAASNAEKA